MTNVVFEMHVSISNALIKIKIHQDLICIKCYLQHLNKTPPVAWFIWTL